MRILLLILFIAALGHACAQLPTDTRVTQKSTGIFQQGYNRADSGHISAVRDTFNARYPGTRILRILAGDTSEWFNAYGRWFKNLTTKDTSNRWASNFRRLPGTTTVQMQKGSTWVDVYQDSVGAGGGSQPANTRYSVTKGTADSIQLVNDLLNTPSNGREYAYGWDSTGARGYQENKYVIAKRCQELRVLRNVDTAHIYRVINGLVAGDFYFDPLDATSVDDSAMIIVTTGGKRLKRYINNVIDARWFGANPADDAKYDDVALQKAINWVIKYRNHGTLYLPTGVYWLQKGLVVYKDLNLDGIYEFVSIDIVGDKVGGNVQTFLDGNGGETVVMLRDSTDFCIAVQKGKTMTISNINFQGFNLDYSLDDVRKLADPNEDFLLPGIRNNRYSPNSAIVIDPFQLSVLSGNRYPRHADWYTDPLRSGSSAINIQNCYIRGFAVGIANSPNGINQNAECHNFEHLWIDLCKSAIVNCNSQARTVYCRDIKCWGGVEVVFDHQRYGDGTSSAMYMKDINIAGGVKWLIATTGWGIGYNHVISDGHAELLYGIGGDIVNGSTSTGNIILENLQLDFTYEALDQLRNPIIAYCNVLEMRNSVIGLYSGEDNSILFVNAGSVIRRNTTGNLIATQAGFDNTSYNEFSPLEGNNPRYYQKSNSSISNTLALYSGLEVYKNAYLEFAGTGFQLRQKYVGPSMNQYTLSGSYIPVSLDSLAHVATFNVGSQIYKCAPGATVASYIPDDINQTVRLTTIGVVTSVNVGAQTVTISHLLHKVHNGSAYVLNMFQQPQLHGNAAFYIGDITASNPLITNITGDYDKNTHTMQVGQYFNHPAFIPGTYITAVTSNSITLSTNAIYSQTGAFVLNEANWECTGTSGTVQTTANFIYNETVFKEGDIVRIGYANNSNALDTSVAMYVCVKAGKMNTSRAPVFKAVYNESPSIKRGTAPPATTPAKIGDLFVDTTNKKIYIATGTTSSADWTITN